MSWDVGFFAITKPAFFRRVFNIDNALSYKEIKCDQQTKETSKNKKKNDWSVLLVCLRYDESIAQKNGWF